MSYEHRIMCEQLRHKLSAVERERDEYKHRCKVSDGACAIAEQQRDHWMQRAKVADAEIAGRDAVAGDPVAWKWRLISIDDESQTGPWRLCLAPLNPGKGAGYKTEAIPLYTAAPPAVLSPEYHAAMKKLRHTLANCNRLNYCAEALQDVENSLALGAQQQKVVELYKRKSMEVISGQRYSYVLLEDLLPELDAAGVKWEVKK